MLTRGSLPSYALVAVLFAVGPALGAQAAGAPAPLDRPARSEGASDARVLPPMQDPFPSTYQPRAATELLIRGATVLDGVGGRIEGGDVLLRAGKVVAVGQRVANPGGVREIDARGRWVTPGIIDVHSHNGTFVRPLTAIDREAGDVADLSDLNVADTRIETAMNPQDIGFALALRAGVTTIQVLPGSSPIFGGHAVVVKPVPANTVTDMKFPDAPQGFKMACGENPKSFGAETRRAATSRSGVVAYTRRAFLDAREYLAEWQRFKDGKGTPPRRDLKREALARILEGQVRVHMHCYRSDDMATALDVAREMGFKITAFHHAVDAYKIADRLRAAGTCAAVFADWWGFKMELQDALRANGAMLQQSGVCTMMHSDSPATGQRLNTEAAKIGAAARRLGLDMPAEQLIRWTTSAPAAALGLDDRIGTLAPGRNADVVLWSADPFSIYAKADLVLIDGVIRHDRAAPRDPASDFELGRPTMERSQ